MDASRSNPGTAPFRAQVEAALQRFSAGAALGFSGVRGGGHGWLVAQLERLLPGGPLLVVRDSLRGAEALVQDLAFFGTQGVWLYPHWDTIPYDGFSPNKELMAQRLAARAALAGGSCRVLVTTPQAMMQPSLPAALLAQWRFSLAAGETVPRRDLVERLLAAGYSRVDLVEAPGEFSARGEIVDIFPTHTEQPVRLDFFDDELESLRWFEVDSQQSVGDLTRIEILPASEGVINAETAGRALKLLPDHKAGMQPDAYRQLYHYVSSGAPYPGQEQMLALFYEQVAHLPNELPATTTVVVDEPERVERTAEQFFGEVLQEHEFSLGQGALALPPETMFLPAAALKSALSKRRALPLHELRLEAEPGVMVCPLADNHSLRVPDRPDGRTLHATLDEVLERLRRWQQAGAPVVLAARSQTAAERVKQLLNDHGLGVRVDVPRPELLALTGEEATPAGELARDLVLLAETPSEGFRLVDAEGETRFALITEDELLGEKTRQRTLKRASLQHFLASLGELKEGDLVVHVEYGIGRYGGLRKMAVGAEEGDFLVIEYAGQDKVYVPVYKFNQVQKYTGAEGAAPQVNKLGDGAWAKTKARAAKAVEDMAEDLVALYAARKARGGVAYEANHALLTEFEEAFPFQETEDQQRAIEEVLGDMAGEIAMDRLVCGDVGFGKTEVAMRAACVAALNGKQALMLVPTTILAQQHHETFRRRFAEFPVNLDVISRFRSPQDQKRIVQEFAEGKLDILIGTHRLLSKDIKARDLGLLIIDEEQRFGVAHKERLKRMRTQVDVVTLSATPIPRTLHMSLMGVRDLSVINTPPMDRIAIRTRLVKFSDYIIKEAIEREVRRGGQVFFVHNRVENIHSVGTYVQGLLPHIRMGVAHGQMPEKRLEEVMLAFVNGEIDVLISTTIVESGLDIPRANTMIVNNADFFGLSQLYQLRGRVGRSNVQAYTYLLVSPDKVLTEVAQKRLTLLQELNDLGSGFKIASHDLEIRGAGNLLGSEQSGHINGVGLELFTHMVEEAVARLKGEDLQREEVLEGRLDLGFPFMLPDEYIPATRSRLDVYKQLADIRSEEELWQVREQLEDRYGRMPPEMGTLFTLVQVRVLAGRYGLSTLERAGGQLQARVGRPDRINVDALMALVANPELDVKLVPEDRLLLGSMPDSPDAVLERLRVLEPIVVPKAA